jgi:hypothetical protein
MTTEKNIRSWIRFFMIVLLLSGITAIPIETELEFVSRFFSFDNNIGQWIDRVYQAVHETNSKFPFLAYGYDWLAFAHFVLAILFIGPLKDPVRNKWVIEFGLLACLLIIPFALIAGHFRNIPLWWRMIDCSFGLIGMFPLFICLKQINRLETITDKNYHYEISE